MTARLIRGEDGVNKVRSVPIAMRRLLTSATTFLIAMVKVLIAVTRILIPEPTLLIGDDDRAMVETLVTRRSGGRSRHPEAVEEEGVVERPLHRSEL